MELRISVAITLWKLCYKWHEYIVQIIWYFDRDFDVDSTSIIKYMKQWRVFYSLMICR